MGFVLSKSGLDTHMMKRISHNGCIYNNICRQDRMAPHETSNFIQCMHWGASFNEIVNKAEHGVNLSWLSLRVRLDYYQSQIHPHANRG